jgi:hypothetical protein
MKLTLEVKQVEERIVDTTEGQSNSYRLVMEGEGHKAVIASPEPFTGFKAGARVSMTIANPQTNLD